MLLTETFFNNALPTIMSIFDISQSTAQWLSTGYLLVAGLMIPISAWVFKSFSTRNVFILLLFIFLVGSLIGFFSTNFFWVLVARLVQAVAAGSTIPLVQNVILTIYSTSKRGTVMGIAGLIISFAPSIGPTLAGWIIDNLGWRWLFGVLLPLSILVVLLAFLYTESVKKPTPEKLDLISTGESTIGFGAVLYSFSIIGNSGRLSLLSLFSFIIGLTFVYLFLKRQTKIKHPLIELRVFQNNNFNIATGLSALSNIILLGIELVIPMYLQNVHEVSALISGLVLLPGAVLMGLLNPIAGKIFDRFGIRIVSIVGYSLISLGTVPMLMFNLKTNLILVTIVYSVRMIGIALVMQPTFTAGINALSESLVVYGNAAASTIRQIAGSLGTALLMMIVSFGDSFSNQSTVLMLNQGYRFAFYFAFIISMLGIILSFRLKTK